MDPLTLLSTALVTGAAAGAVGTAHVVVKDSYEGLKLRLLKYFDGNQKAESTLLELEKDPDTYEKPMRKQLELTGAYTDTEVIEAARTLLEAVDPRGYRVGKYSVQVGGGQIGSVGDSNYVYIDHHSRVI